MLTILRNTFLSLVLIISNAYAQDCFDPSPTVQNNSEMFTEIKPREITESEYNALNLLFKYLNRDWDGSGKEIICKGKKPDAYKEIKQYKISAETTMNYQGNFTIRLELYDSENRTSSQEKYDLFLTEKYLRADSDNGAGDIELIEISENNVSYKQRSLHGSGPPFGIRSRGEVFTTIRRTSDGFIMTKLYYHQGILGGKKQWVFYN